MRLGLGNIKNFPDMAPGRVRQDAATIAPLVGMFWGQEIQPGEDTPVLVEEFGPRFGVRHADLEIPIFYRKPIFAVHAEGRLRAHEGREDVSPDRWSSWIIAALRRRPELDPIVYMNTHFVSRQNDLDDDVRNWARRNWEDHHELMSAKIHEFVDRGLTVVFGGDLNRGEVPDFHPKQRWIINVGVDKLGVVTPRYGTKVDCLGVDVVDLNSDHNLKVARLRLS